MLVAHVNGCAPAVSMSYKLQNLRLFRLSNVSVTNSRSSLLMSPWPVRWAADLTRRLQPRVVSCRHGHRSQQGSPRVGRTGRGARRSLPGHPLPRADCTPPGHDRRPGVDTAAAGGGGVTGQRASPFGRWGRQVFTVKSASDLRAFQDNFPGNLRIMHIASRLCLL